MSNVFAIGGNMSNNKETNDITCGNCGSINRVTWFTTHLQCHKERVTGDCKSCSCKIIDEKTMDNLGPIELIENNSK